MTSNLSSLLQIKIQSILLPALFVPPDIRPTHINDSSSQSQQYQQDLAIAASNSKTIESEFNLPKGGGPFKGFGFIILEDVADREKVLKDWSWKKEELNLKKEELIDPVSTKPSALIDVEEEEESEVSIEKMMDLADESILEETISIALVETLTEATDSIFGDLLESKLISELNKEKMESERLRKVDMEKAKKSGMKALSL